MTVPELVVYIKDVFELVAQNTSPFVVLSYLGTQSVSPEFHSSHDPVEIDSRR